MSSKQNPDATEIIKGLWIGNLHSAQNKKFFEKEIIGAVVNCTPDIPNTFETMGVLYLNIPMNDTLKEKDIKDMNRYLARTVKFIHTNLSNKRNVLVHCHAGMQRSAAVVAAYLMKYHKKSIMDAINLIIYRRPIAFFYGQNVNFLNSLIIFSKNI